MLVTSTVSQGYVVGLCQNSKNYFHHLQARQSSVLRSEGLQSKKIAEQLHVNTNIIANL